MLTADESQEICAYLNDESMAAALVEIVKRHANSSVASAKAIQVSSQAVTFEVQVAGEASTISVDFVSPIQAREDLRAAFFQLLYG